jgi:hypothetical protein
LEEESPDYKHADLPEYDENSAAVERFLKMPKTT